MTTSKLFNTPRLLLMAAVLSAAASQPAAAQSGDCNRVCMQQVLDQYLAALVKHDPKTAALAPSFRATVNQDVTKPGEGLWSTMTGLGVLQRRYFDPVSHQAAFYGQIQEGAKTSVGIIRIKLDGRRITESEAIVARDGDQMFSAAGAAENAPRPDSAIPPADRVSRADLQRAADSYFEALEKKNDALVIKQDGCVRIESGVKVTQRKPPPQPGANVNTVEFDSGDCAEGLSRMVQIDKVAYRRFPVIDEQAGVAVGMAMFTRPAGSLRGNGQPWQRLMLSEVFTTKKGKIDGIYAAMHYLAADKPNGTGW